MYQRQTLDTSLLISMIIHSCLALIFSFISIQYGVISPPRIFEVAMIEIPQRTLTEEAASLSAREKISPPTVIQTLAPSLEKGDRARGHEIVELPRGEAVPGKIDERIVVREKVIEPKANLSPLKGPRSLGLSMEPAIQPTSPLEKDAGELLPEEPQWDKTSVSRRIFIPEEVGLKTSPSYEGQRESDKRGAVTPFPITKGPLKGRGIRYREPINLPEEKEKEAIPRAGEFKLWVIPDGSVEKVEIERTTGDSEIDILVKKAFLKWRFEALPPSENRTDWGLVSVKISFK
ncbi:MAG: energy transducer TonB [bacterium]